MSMKHLEDNTTFFSFFKELFFICLISFLFIFLPVFLILKGFSFKNFDEEKIVNSFKKNEQLICKDSYLISLKNSWQLIEINEKRFFKKEDILIDISLCEVVINDSSNFTK